MRSLGLRALDIAQQELIAGIRERPAGSNDGPRVREYLAPCKREQKSGPPVLLNMKASNWCSAFASWCHDQALRPDERAAHGYRIGVLELVTDAKTGEGFNGKFSGDWLSISDVRSGLVVPMPGDLAIYDRSVAGRPDTNWWRHVNRVETWDDDTYYAIGGNEQQKVRRARHNVDNPRLMGFVLYPKMGKSGFSQPPLVRPMLSEQEKDNLLGMVALSLDGILRSSVHGE